MKKDFTSINVVMDRSGSMGGLKNDTIGSFNTFLAEQKVGPGEAVFTLCTFNTESRLVHDFVKLASVPDLNAETYQPSGGTSLLDALGDTINSVGAKLAAMPESERPEKVIVVVITDGEENSSTRFTKAEIKAMIEHQESVYKWNFVFTGANLDSVHEATSLGMRASNSFNYTPSSVGTQQLYKSISENMTSYRGSKSQQVDFFNQPVVDSSAPPPPSKDNK